MSLLLLLCAIHVSLFAMPGSATLCPLGEDDPISLCAMCSDEHAAVRWNISDVVSPRTMSAEYTCVDPQNSTTQVLSSGQDSCFTRFPPFSDLLTGVAAIGAEIAAGVQCNFTVFFRYVAPGKGVKLIRIDESCIIRSTEVCETNPEECPLDYVCGVHEEGNCGCYCASGYNGEGCTNIDECAPNGTHTCHEQADCFDTEGSYECECKEGYEGDGHSNCSDINECEYFSYPCHENAQCTNTDGSFSCECRAGYTGDGYNNCSDIDECKLDGVCHEDANCINTQGSYDCECSSGYEGNGHDNCSDIDECELTGGPCHEDAECTNTEGSYECACRTGFEGDGYYCTDIDECETTDYTCPEVADCLNTNGSYECVCWPGYRKVGHNCTDASPSSVNVSAVVSGVVISVLLLVLLLSVLILVIRYLSYRSDRLPRDILPVKDLDLFYTPTFSGWKGSMTSIHSVYEELQFPTSLTLITKLGSTQQLDTPADPVSVKTLDNESITAITSPAPPSPTTSVPSSFKQEALKSPECMAMSSTASDYHQADGVTGSKELEQEELSTSDTDTLSISDIIAAMEEDISPSIVEQATNAMYLPSNANGDAKICDTLTSTTSSSATSTTQPQSTAIGYVHLPPQEFTTAPVTSSPTQPLPTTAGYVYDGNTSISLLSSTGDSGNGTLDFPFGEDLSSEPASPGEWSGLQYVANSISSGYVSESVASESEGYRHSSCVLHEMSSCSSHAMATASDSMENRPHIVTDTKDTVVAIDRYQDCPQQSEQFAYLHEPIFTTTDNFWQTSAKEPTLESFSDFDEATDIDCATATHQVQYVNCVLDHINDVQFDITPQTF